VTVHHVNVQYARAAALDGLDLVSETGKICRQNRWSDVDVAVGTH
jgi:hypothetical protein